ncbi:che-10 [Pristionchus pacificus]|uniref:Che-10 n=1 Tax=Pristionchus pacificus TaxID=54126 RepID=A0A2A6B615_PRIPA|nr:che-10 [Pristionchus pacificus]|eukprot:PDM61293.1 che-10 [Pristionchus pacificus]
MEWKTTTAIDIGEGGGDLSECRSRLDASVEENRKNRHVIEEINQQIARFRRRNAEEDAIRGASTSHLDRPSTSNWHFSQSTNNIHDVGYASGYGSFQSGVGGGGGGGGGGGEGGAGGSGGAAGALSVSLVGLDGAGAGPHTPSTMMANTLVIPIRTEVEHRPKHHRSSPTLVLQDDDLYTHFDQHAVDRLLYRLNQETYKNDTLEEVISMLRSEAQAAQSANQMLRADVTDINRALETVQAMRRNDQLQFVEESARFRRRNEQQNRQLIELFHAFKAHRRQVDDLRQSTREELDRQLAEFKRAAALMATALGQKHHSNRVDETIQDIVVKYERLMEKNLDTEKEKSKQILKLESTLKRTSDERDTLLESLGRIAKMPELTSNGSGHRTRSVSPTGGTTVFLSGSGHLEIQRKIRSALSMRTTEVRDLTSKAERAEKEVDRLKRSLEKTENEAKINHDEKRTVEQREKKKLHEFAELERSVRRAQERISSLEEEKRLMQEEVDRLQKNLTDALKSHKDFIEELSSRHRDELTDRVAKAESETAERIAEMKAKVDRMREDSEREKNEGERIRANLRDTIAQLAVMTKRSDEYNSTNSSLEQDKNRLRAEIDRLNERLNENEKTILDLRISIDERTESETKLLQRVTELNSTEALVREDSAGLQEELRELRIKVEEMTRNEEKNRGIVMDLRSKQNSAEESMSMSDKTIKNLRLTILAMEQKLEEKTSEHTHAVAELEKNISRFDMATKDLLELQETLMEFASERDSLSEALSAMKLEYSAMEAKLTQAERKLHERNDEEVELRQQLEISHATVRKMEEEMGERTRQLEITRDQLIALEGNFKRQDIGNADEMKKLESRLRDEMATTVEEMETKMRIVRGEKNALEETLNGSEKKLDEIVRMHEQLMENYSLAQHSIQEWRDRVETIEVERRRERNELAEANAIDREEWETEREKLDRQRNNSLSELRDELTRMEHDLKETSSALERVVRERDEAIEEIETMKRRMDEVKREGERQRDASLHADSAHTNERHTLIARLEETNLQNSKVQSLLDQTQRKHRSIEEELVNSQRMLTEKSRLLIEVETSLNGLMERLREAEIRENSLKDSLASTEGERDEWRRVGEDAKRGEKEAEMRANELNERLLSIERELHHTRSHLDQERNERSGGKEKVAELTGRAVQLESILVSKTSQLETFKNQISHLEEEKSRLKEKMEVDSGKTEELIRANETLRRTLTQLKEELNIAQKSMDVRSSSSRHAMDELLVRFRDTDSKLVETAGEADRLRNTVHSLRWGISI